MINDVLSTQTISIGKQGENQAQTLQFVCSYFADKYGAGTPVLVHQRPGDSRPYVVPTTYTAYNTMLTWVVSSADTLRSGTGHAEIRWYVNDVLAKSAVFGTTIDSALMDSNSEAPGGLVYMIDGQAFQNVDDTLAAIAKLEARLVKTFMSDAYTEPGVNSWEFACNGNGGFKFSAEVSNLTFEDKPGTKRFPVKFYNGTSLAGTIVVSAEDTPVESVIPSSFNRVVVDNSCDVNIMSITVKIREEAPIVTWIKAHM